MANKYSRYFLRTYVLTVKADRIYKDSDKANLRVHTYLFRKSNLKVFFRMVYDATYVGLNDIHSFNVAVIQTKRT